VVRSFQTKWCRTTSKISQPPATQQKPKKYKTTTIHIHRLQLPKTKKQKTKLGGNGGVMDKVWKMGEKKTGEWQKTGGLRRRVVVGE
jgi:hypothetical protein